MSAMTVMNAMANMAVAEAATTAATAGKIIGPSFPRTSTNLPSPLRWILPNPRIWESGRA